MKSLVPHIGYPGSLLQQDYGESLDHGYLVWDVDTETRRHSVEYVPLPNPRPFVTIVWDEDVVKTFEVAAKWPRSSRFRVRSTYPLSSADASVLSARLRRDLDAFEVVFVSDDSNSARQFASAGLEVDVRSLVSQQSMLREYYSRETIDPHVWDQMSTMLVDANARVVDDAVSHGVVWTLKSVEFDNLYGYGEDNRLDLSERTGIVGILGPNCIGKSSIVGTITYTLFNSSDRDVGKNALVVNVAKKSGRARAVVNVAGSDYEVRRETVKVMSRGSLTANTSLMLRQIDGAVDDLTGEQRPDTEKNLRKLLGTYEDFVLTSGQVQDDVGRFLREGPTQRKAILAKFLGTDVFDKLHSIISGELNELRAKLKIYHDEDRLVELIGEVEGSRADNNILQSELNERVSEIRRDLEVAKHESVDLRAKLREYEEHLSQEEQRRKLEETIASSEKLLEKLGNDVECLHATLDGDQQSLDVFPSWDKFDERIAQITMARERVRDASQAVTTAVTERDRSRNISLKLVGVPCGDSFPTCPYIKDALIEQARSSQLEEVVADRRQREAEERVQYDRHDEAGLTLLKRQRRSLEKRIDETVSALLRCEVSRSDATKALETARRTLDSLGSMTDDPENVRGSHDRVVANIKSLQNELVVCESEQRDALRVAGRLEATHAKLLQDVEERKALTDVVRARELLVNAFSRRGIPNVVLSKLLPMVNGELDKILNGIVTFRLFLRADEDTNALDILLDEDGVVRPLELGSGMERMIGSLALRVALCNLTTLPKPDFMVIDEGFGSLDDVNVTACVELLRSLKRWFRFVLVISHVEIIKEAVDAIVEITRDANGFARVRS